MGWDGGLGIIGVGTPMEESLQVRLKTQDLKSMRYYGIEPAGSICSNIDNINSNVVWRMSSKYPATS